MIRANLCEVLEIRKHLFLNGAIDGFKRYAEHFCDFDKDGFDLNSLEVALYSANHIRVNSFLNRQAAQYQWFTFDVNENVRVDHALLLARYAYVGELRDQIYAWSEQYPELRKLLQIKPKWGLDFNIEYITPTNQYMDIIHIEEDFHDYNAYSARKDYFEQLIQRTNWVAIGSQLYNLSYEWCSLNADDENDYKARYIGLEKAYNTIKVI